MKNWFEEILNDLVNPQMRISDILRKASILASQLKNEDFKKWLKLEQHGYAEGDNIPEYRRFHTEISGYFSGPFGSALKNAPIPFYAFPKPLWETIQNLDVHFGIRSIEVTADGGEGADILQSSVPAHFLPDINAYKGYSCIGAWHIWTRTQFAQIIDVVRNRLLAFMLELQEHYPELTTSSDALKQIPEEDTKQVFMMNIYGGIHGSNVAIDKSKIESSQANVNLHDDEQRLRLSELVRMFKQELPTFGLEPEVLEEASSDIATIEAQLASPKPKNVVVNESLKSLRSITEGAIGSIAAAHLPMLIQCISHLQI